MLKYGLCTFVLRKIVFFLMLLLISTNACVLHTISTEPVKIISTNIFNKEVDKKFQQEVIIQTYHDLIPLFVPLTYIGVNETAYILGLDEGKVSLIGMESGMPLGVSFHKGYILLALEKVKNGVFTEIIYVHTHQIQSIEDFFSLNKYESYRQALNITNIPRHEVQRQIRLMKKGVIPFVYSPPSWLDIVYAFELLYVHAERGVINTAVSLVAEPGGLWVYYIQNTTKTHLNSIAKQFGFLDANVVDCANARNGGKEYTRLLVKVLTPYPQLVIDKYLQGDTVALDQVLKQRAVYLSQMRRLLKSFGFELMYIKK